MAFKSLGQVRAEQAEKQRQKQIAKAGGLEAFAEAERTRTEAIEGGAWWLRPDAFAAFGITRKLTLAECAYLGGYPAHPKAHGSVKGKNGNSLHLSSVGLVYKRFGTLFTIPWDEVLGIEVEGPEKAERHMSLGLGALSLLKSHKSAAITVLLKSGDEAVFQSHTWLAYDLRARLGPITSQLRKLHTAEVLPTSPPTVSVADEIRKLAELRDSGIVTEAEFEAKKADLLGRM
ncbi:MAG TPA: SHOCT domain-containing protein [Candidatus Acidoferrales bacterium]|nr:SHOCT domain-containing protein [Candidatus Micrarchaeaceae archaeon]HVB54070.1 SHOCT domain-containing protein [Candidatus Acidoferrales bacterium]